MEQATSESISCLLPEMAVAMSNKLRFQIFGKQSRMCEFILLILVSPTLTDETCHLGVGCLLEHVLGVGAWLDFE